MIIALSRKLLRSRSRSRTLPRAILQTEIFSRERRRRRLDKVFLTKFADDDTSSAMIFKLRRTQRTKSRGEIRVMYLDA